MKSFPSNLFSPKRTARLRQPCAPKASGKFLRHLVQIVAGVAGLCIVATNATPIHSSAVFPPGTTINSPTLQPYFRSLAVADIDGDGKSDVVALSLIPAKLAWYRNLGNGTFGPQNLISHALASPTCVFAADLNADGWPDLVASSGPPVNKVAWYRNLGGTFAAEVALPVTNNLDETTTAVSVANLDGAGLPDIISTSYSSVPGNPLAPYLNRVAWFKNEGIAGNPVPTFQGMQVLSNQGVSPNAVSTADFDGNGWIDLLVASNDDHTLAWLRGTGLSGGVPQFTRYVIANNLTGAYATSVGDLDGDGIPDAVCGALFGDSATAFRNKFFDAASAAPFFAPGQKISGAGAVNGVGAVHVADIDGDGKNDVVTGSLEDNKVAWYPNLGAGNFGWNPSSPTANQRIVATDASGVFDVSTHDFDQNGLTDIVAGCEGDGRVIVYFNRGGQSAVTSANTAPTTILGGAKDDVLTISMSSRGIPGDHNAAAFSVTLLLEKLAGVSLNSAEANALIENLQIYADTNSSGAFEPASDSLVGTVGDLQLSAGRITINLTPSLPADVEIPPASTRKFFVVTELTANAATQIPNAFRITHVSRGSGASVIKDATSGDVLTVEFASNPDAPSSFVTATPSLTPIQVWRQFWFNTILNTGVAADTYDGDGDGAVNLMEFAFGTNPIVSSSNPLTISGGSITAAGKPTTIVTNTATTVDFRALFGRRKDYVAAGLTYTVEFSADLIAWVASNDVPIVVASNAELDAVTVPYPFFVNGKKARFFRVSVTSP